MKYNVNEIVVWIDYEVEIFMDCVGFLEMMEVVLVFM